MLSVLASCDSAGQTVQVNTVRAAALTAEQQEVLNLFSMPNHELLAFEFKTDDSFSRVEVWVEIYERGELVDRPAGLISSVDSGGARSGHIAIIVNQNDNAYQWTLSLVENGARYSHSGTAGAPVGPGLGRAFGPMNDPVDIEDGKEIIIYSSTFQTAGNPHNAYDAQTLQERPELLLEYPYAHLIKVIFTK